MGPQDPKDVARNMARGFSMLVGELAGEGKQSGDRRMPTRILLSWPTKTPPLTKRWTKPQGSQAAHQGNPEPHVLAGYDRWRELPRPPHAPLYGARHDCSGIPRGQASERSLTSRRFNDATSEIFLKKRSEMRVVAAVP